MTSPPTIPKNPARHARSGSSLASYFAEFVDIGTSGEENNDPNSQSVSLVRRNSSTRLSAKKVSLNSYSSPESKTEKVGLQTKSTPTLHKKSLSMSSGMGAITASDFSTPFKGRSRAISDIGRRSAQKYISRTVDLTPRATPKGRSSNGGGASVKSRTSSRPVSINSMNNMGRANASCQTEISAVSSSEESLLKSQLHAQLLKTTSSKQRLEKQLADRRYNDRDEMKDLRFLLFSSFFSSLLHVCLWLSVYCLSVVPVCLSLCPQGQRKT